MDSDQGLDNQELIIRIVEDVADDVLETTTNHKRPIEPVGIDPGLEAKTYMSTKEVYEIFKVCGWLC